MEIRKPQWSGKKLKRNLAALFSLATLGISTLTPVVSTVAEEAQSEVENGYSEYAGKAKNTHEVLGKFSGEGPAGDRENTFRYLFSRLVVPQYINNVETATYGKGADKSLLVDGKYACNPADPLDLVHQNCTVPNFSAQLGQSFMRVLNPGGIVGGERREAKPAFGWGVPDRIPGQTVPINENERRSKYTGLEAFGYSTGYTSYTGEWDDIIPSTSARMLSNFGMMDRINLTGTSIWNGIKSGLGEFVDGLEWNPTTWLGSLGDAFEGATTGGLLTVIDTSDANVIATRSWVRSGNSVSRSFYNVKVLTDKEVMDASLLRVANKFTNDLIANLNGDARLAKVLSMEAPPEFTYDPNLETEASKKARANARAKNEEIDRHNAEVERTGKGKKKNHVTVPEKKIVPEKEQFAKFKKTDGRVAEGKTEGINCDNDNIGDFKACWAKEFESYRDENFNANSETLKKLIKKTEERLFKDDPYADPTKAIGHYVCADSEGNAKKNGSEYVYLYNKDYSVNKGCAVVRPTVQGGYFGNGYDDKISDTRHMSNIEGDGLLASIPAIGNLNKGIANFATAVSRFIAQLINEMLNLSFSPLMERLGITTIVEHTMSSLKKTVFFPMITIAIAIAALSMLWNIVRTRNATKFFTTLLGMLITFFVGVTILNSPGKVVNYFDKMPAEAEQFVASLILNNENEKGLCSTSTSDANHGVRAAQCNVWNTLVFQPWTYGQFGTNYRNLDVNKMKNTNGDLVGDATVNLGGGVRMHNWALYQLKLMTSGTITESDAKHPVGKADNNLYRIVDMQAGPNWGEGRDARYFASWQGHGGNRATIGVEAAALSVFTLISLGSLLLVKIELTFIFSIMMLGLPFMLLYGLTPKGRRKLISYGATMGSILLKRMLAVGMISVMLLLMNVVVPDNASSYHMVFIGSLIVLGFFKFYKKEIFDLFKLNPQNAFAGEGVLSGDPEAFRAVIKENTPKFIKNKILMSKKSVQGYTSGAIGGAVGGAAGVLSTIKRENKQGAKDPNFIKRSPSRIVQDVRKGMLTGVKEGAASQAKSQQNRERREMAREGLDILTVTTQAKDEVRRVGSEHLQSGVGADGTSSVVNKEIEDRRKLHTPDTSPIISDKDQKTARNIAKDIESTVKNKNLSVDERKAARDDISKRMDIAAGARDKREVRLENRNKIKAPLQHILTPNVEAKEDKVGTNVREHVEKAPETLNKIENGAGYNKHEAKSGPSIHGKLPDLSAPDLESGNFQANSEVEIGLVGYGYNKSPEELESGKSRERIEEGVRAKKAKTTGTTEPTESTKTAKPTESAKSAKSTKKVDKDDKDDRGGKGGGSQNRAKEEVRAGSDRSDGKLPELSTADDLKAMKNAHGDEALSDYEARKGQVHFTKKSTDSGVSNKEVVVDIDKGSKGSIEMPDLKPRGGDLQSQEDRLKKLNDKKFNRFNKK